MSVAEGQGARWYTADELGAKLGKPAAWVWAHSKTLTCVVQPDSSGTGSGTLRVHSGALEEWTAAAARTTTTNYERRARSRLEEARKMTPDLTADELAKRARQPKTPNMDALRASKPRHTGAEAAAAHRADWELNHPEPAQARGPWGPIAPVTAVEEAKAEAKRTATGARERLGLEVRERSPYGPASPHSYFQDLVTGSWNVNRDNDAPERLRRHKVALEQGREQRAVSTSTIGALVPGASGLPLWVSEAFSAAARTASPLYHALNVQPMPSEGVTVPVAKTTAAGTAAVQAENAGVALGSLTISLDSEPVSLIASGYQYSFQGHDRGGAIFDEMLAADLAAQWYALVESELFSGAGSGGHVRGLASMSAGTNVTVAGQTFANQFSATWNTYQQTAVALGRAPDMLVVAERRLAWWQAQSQNTSIAETFPATIVASPAAPLTLGGGTEDWAFLINRDSAPVFTTAALNGPEIKVDAQASGSTLTADVTVSGYVAFATNRRPEGVGIVKGITAAGTTF